MKSDYKVFLDTNILIHSTLEDFEPSKNTESIHLIKQLIQRDVEIFISTQIIREFYAIVTSTKFLKDALNPEQAAEQIQYFLKIFSIINVGHKEVHQTIELCKKNQIKGQEIHDTTIAGTMISNEIKNIITFNKKDFIIFQQIKTFLPGEYL